MWRPEFAFVEQVRGRIHGFHRALCIYSHHWRGTPERPGLVLGLDRGGSCVGSCFRIAAEAAATTLEQVRARELVTSVYEEIAAPVRLADGRRQVALAYVARRDHHQFAGTLPLTEVVRIVRGGTGAGGSNMDYVQSTVRHLGEMGLRDAVLEAVAAGCAPAVAPLIAPPARPERTAP